MSCSRRYRVSLLLAAILSVFALAQPTFGRNAVYAPPAAQTSRFSGSYSGTYGGSYSGQNALNIPWSSNTINLSQLEDLILKNPAFSKLNIQFPDQSSWGITPDTVQSMMGMFQGEAQSVGVTGKLPDLSFSSVALAAAKSGSSQFSVNPNGDIKSQMDDVLRQVRYQTLDLSNNLPDWLKRIVLAVYDAVYSTFEFLGAQLAGLFQH